MEENKSIYVGNAKAINENGMKIQINLTQLWEALKNADVKDSIHTYTDRNGTENKTISLAVWKLKPENVTEFRTHSVKIDTWKPDPNYQKPVESEGEGEGKVDELPF